MTSLHVRLTGLACIVAGISISAGGLIHILFHTPFGHWVLYFGYLVLVFAFTGIYAIQARQTGLLGLAGYLLAVSGTMLVSISAYLMLADVAGFEAGHEAWMFMYINLGIYLPGMYAFLLGVVLLGLATAYGHVLPRYAGLMLALAAITDLPAEMVASMGFMYFISSALLLTSLCWIGITLILPRTIPHLVSEPNLPLMEG